MSILDAISEHFHEKAWPEHCRNCDICAPLNPRGDYDRLCPEGKKLAGWMQEF